jgi:hypothetical protein
MLGLRDLSPSPSIKLNFVFCFLFFFVFLCFSLFLFVFQLFFQLFFSFFGLFFGGRRKKVMEGQGTNRFLPPKKICHPHNPATIKREGENHPKESKKEKPKTLQNSTPASNPKVSLSLSLSDDEPPPSILLYSFSLPFPFPLPILSYPPILF